MYPPYPCPMLLRTVAPMGMAPYQWRCLPSRYHWFVWLEHAGEQMYYVYDNTSEQLLKSPDTTIDQLLNDSGYSPLDFEPMCTDWDLDFKEFLASSIKAEYRSHFPFLAKYGLACEKDEYPHEYPVAYKFVDKALSLVEDKETIEQDLWHIFCIICDSLILRNL